MTEVISALVAVILSLGAVIRFYLPYHDRRMHNPWAERLIAEVNLMRQEATTHHTWERATLEEIRRGLERLEGKLK